LAGTLYAQSIVQALDECRLFILILTERSVASGHVGKELERAASRGHPILALKMDSASLTPAFEYFLNESHWIDAGAQSLDAAIDQLIDAVRRHSAPKESVAGAGVAPPPIGRSANQKGLRRPWIVAAVLAMSLAIAYVGVSWRGHRQASGPAAGAHATLAAADRSIAVLPFADMSEKQDQAYFADGMAEEILDLLVKVPGLTVIGRTSSFQFKGKSADLRNIGAALGAAYVVEGSVRKAGDRIRVTAQLIDAQSGTHRWSGAYDREFGDVLALQHDIAVGVARALQVTVAPDDAESHGKLRNARAYTLYLQGRYGLDRGDAGGYQEAQANLEQALALDPSFLSAAEKLANAYAGATANEFMPSDTGWQKARSAAERAVALDANSAARAVLAIRLALYEFDLPAADQLMAIVLQSHPANPVVLAGAARLAVIRGRYDEALRLMNTALTLDPLNPAVLQDIGYIHYFAGRLPAAESALRSSIEISATFSASHYALGQVLLAGGATEAALKEMEKVTMDDGRDAGLAITYHALGRHAESDKSTKQLIDDHGKDWPYGIAQVYAYRMDRDNAMRWLEAAYAQRDPDLQLVKIDPLLRNMQGDPRYESFLHKLKRS
jgi:TolB-like protein